MHTDNHITVFCTTINRIELNWEPTNLTVRSELWECTEDEEKLHHQAKGERAVESQSDYRDEGDMVMNAKESTGTPTLSACVCVCSRCSQPRPNELGGGGGGLSGETVEGVEEAPHLCLYSGGRVYSECASYSQSPRKSNMLALILHLTNSAKDLTECTGLQLDCDRKDWGPRAFH